MDEEEEFMPPSPPQSRPSSPTYEKPSPETVRYNYEINLVTNVENLIKALKKVNIIKILTGFYLEEFRIKLTNQTAKTLFIRVLKETDMYDTWKEHVKSLPDGETIIKATEIYGGRRNKKRSTRRKKMRGKKTRKYKY